METIKKGLILEKDLRERGLMRVNTQIIANLLDKEADSFPLEKNSTQLC